VNVDRTARATVLAGLIAFASVAGLGVFLGFDAAGSLIAGAVLGVLAALLIWAAARRADSFHPDELPPVEPGFPGPPDHADGSPHEDLGDPED
jgi:hypothetical protein